MKNFVIHTPTKRELTLVLDYLQKSGCTVDRASHNLHSYNADHCVDPTMKDHVMYGDIGFFKSEGYEVVTARTFLIISGVPVPKETSVKLSDNYTAVVNHYDKTVKVGCQVFDFSAIEALAKAMQDQL
jgi:hypothetical protein